MRKRLLTALVLLAALSAPQALACRREASAPPPPQVFWSASPEHALPGESVVEVEFVRGVFRRDRENPDIIIVPSCGPMDDLYRVKRVLAGDGPQDGFLLMSDSHADPEPDRGVNSESAIQF